MTYVTWTTCPAPIKGQVQRLQTCLQTVLSTNLSGVYLHGSLAMGCFNPALSDLDLLIVTARGLSVESKKDMVTYLLGCSLSPRPIEISFLVESAIYPFQHPLPYDLHYSEAWRERYQHELADGTWRHWNKEQRYDDDLSVHIAVTRARGITLYGKTPQETLPAVPANAYIQAIVSDFDDAYERYTNMPLYFILNACRVYAYLCEGLICSKMEGGQWGLHTLPTRYHPIIAQALAVYQNNSEPDFDATALRAFADYMRIRITSYSHSV